MNRACACAPYNADFSRACQLLKLRKVQFSFSVSKLPCKISKVPIAESLYRTKHRDFAGHPQYSCKLSDRANYRGADYRGSTVYT